MKPSGAYIILAVLCAVVFIGSIGRTPVMFFDEEIYSECAREMLASGDYVVPRVDNEYFFDKPPLCYWMQAGSMRVLGVNSLGARLPSALAGVFLVCWTAFVGSRLFGNKAGMYTGFALGSSMLLVGVSQMGIMDNVFALTIGLALGSFILAYQNISPRWGYIGFWAAMGLASLVKGPAGAVLILASAGAFLVLRRDWQGIRRAAPLLGIVLFLAISLPWYVMVHRDTNGAFTQEFFVHQNLARAMGKDFHHNMPWFSYVPLFAVGLFPWSIFTIRAWASHVKLRCDDRAGVSALFAAVWLVSIIGIFTLAKSKLPGYVMPALPGAALLVGLMWSRLAESNKTAALKPYAWTALVIAGVVSAGLQVGQRYLKTPIPGLPEALLPMSVCLFVGPVIALVLIHRKRAEGAFWAFFAGMAGFLGVAVWTGLPIASTTMGEPMVAIARRVRAEAGLNHTIYAYMLHPGRPALAFYTQCPVPDLHERPDLPGILNKKNAVFVIAQEDETRGLPAGGKCVATIRPYILYKYQKKH